MSSHNHHNHHHHHHHHYNHHHHHPNQQQQHHHSSSGSSSHHNHHNPVHNPHQYHPHHPIQQQEQQQQQQHPTHHPLHHHGDEQRMNKTPSPTTTTTTIMPHHHHHHHYHSNHHSNHHSSPIPSSPPPPQSQPPQVQTDESIALAEDDYVMSEWQRGFEMATQASKSDDAKEVCTRSLYIESIEVLLTLKRRFNLMDVCLNQLLMFMIERAEQQPSFPMLSSSPSPTPSSSLSTASMKSSDLSSSSSSSSSIFKRKSSIGNHHHHHTHNNNTSDDHDGSLLSVPKSSSSKMLSSPRSPLSSGVYHGVGPHPTSSTTAATATLNIFSSGGGSSSESCGRFVTEKIAAFTTARAISFDEKKCLANAYEWYMLSAHFSVDLVGKYMPHNASLKRNIMSVMDRIDQLKPFKRQRQYNPLLDMSINIVSNMPTKSEIKVLRETSTINQSVYLPFTSSDEEEANKNAYAMPVSKDSMFSDPMGMIPLSVNQKKRFHSWKRPSEFMSNHPKVLTFPSALSVRQSVITNCSLVSSLCVAAAYEQKFNMPLVTSLIYPQRNGKPVYSPSGKYLIKLHFNAVPRKVIIDDYIPVDASNNILCTHSTTMDLWPTLIEKAYMKLHGGYSFPGSNSAIDLHVLTGWYPEQIVFPRSKKQQQPPFDISSVWTRVTDGWKLGACLMTVSTGVDKSIESVGLETNHAYAVMDVVSTSCGKRLLQVKNPWMKRRWNGRYSPNDSQNWTPSLQRELNYDMLGELQQDNGIFWIDLESLMQYFAVMHLSWNPRLFKFRRTVHEQWDTSQRSSLCRLDHFSIGWNPQYRVRIFGSSSFWVMLHKHWTSMEQRNIDFITFHVYKLDQRQNKFTRLVVDDDCQVISQGQYINDPHYRVCINTPKEDLWHEYMIVISQFKELSPITFSLNVASVQDCTLDAVPYIDQRPPSQVIVCSGQWDQYHCGGSVNDAVTYRNNPQYLLTVSERAASVRLWLDTDSEAVFVNIMVFKNNGQRVELPVDRILYATSGKYRQGFCACTMERVEPNESLTVVVSTFQRNQYARFNLWAETNDVPVFLDAI